MLTFAQYIANQKNGSIEDRLHNSLTIDELASYGRLYLEALKAFTATLPYNFLMVDIAESENLRKFLDIFLQQIQLEPSLTERTTLNIVHFIESMANLHPENTALESLLTDYKKFYSKQIVRILSELRFESTPLPTFILSQHFDTMLELKAIVREHLLSLVNSVDNRSTLVFSTCENTLLGTYCRRRTYIPTMEIGFFKSMIENVANYILSADDLVEKIDARLDEWEKQSPSKIISARQSWTTSSTHSRSRTPSPESVSNNHKKTT